MSVNTCVMLRFIAVVVHKTCFR